MDRFHIARPGHRAGGDVPRPDADLPGFERSANRGKIRKECRCDLVFRLPIGSARFVFTSGVSMPLQFDLLPGGVKAARFELHGENGAAAH